MELYDKSFKVEVGEGRSIVFICRIRSVEVGCYEFFKGITTLSPKVKVLQQQKKLLKQAAMTRSSAQKSDRLDRSSVPASHKPTWRFSRLFNCCSWLYTEFQSLTLSVPYQHWYTTEWCLHFLYKLSSIIGCTFSWSLFSSAKLNKKCRIHHFSRYIFNVGQHEFKFKWYCCFIFYAYIL